MLLVENHDWNDDYARKIGAEIVRELGLQVMAGCMTESSIGISHVAQLLPQLDFVDMDGAALLKSDIASGVSVEKGKAIFPDRAGCGILLDPNVAFRERG